jgi:transketolase
MEAPRPSEALAQSARISALRMVSAANAAHIGSSLSVMDILAVLYAEVANVSPASVDAPERDMVVVSKGHASAATYAILSHSGFFPTHELEKFCSDGQMLMGHVTAGLIPGVEFSTGSLGHGLPFGVGIALADQLNGLDRRVFVVMSDGECDEGSVWEGALLAAHHGLDRLAVIIDRNGLQSFESTESTLTLEPLCEKWQSFGWSVSTVDGHDHSSLVEELDCIEAGRPRVVIAETTKGFGVRFMEDKVEWHYRTPNRAELLEATAELGMTDA